MMFASNGTDKVKAYLVALCRLGRFSPPLFETIKQSFFRVFYLLQFVLSLIVPRLDIDVGSIIVINKEFEYRQRKYNFYFMRLRVYLSSSNSYTGW